MSNSQRSVATYLALATVLVIYPGFRMAVGYLDLFPTQDGRTTWWRLSPTTFFSDIAAIFARITAFSEKRQQNRVGRIGGNAHI